MQGKTLIIGAGGQIGIELTLALRAKLGNQQVIATDIRKPDTNELDNGPFETLDVLNAAALEQLIARHGIAEVYLLAALLSATSEKHPVKAWDLNMNGLFNVLNLARDKKIQRVFWPSSIAVFGPSTPRENTPQTTVMEPSSVYGISKLAGERWCEYYHAKYGVDVRSIRYPGLIGYRSEPGGGTTDYAVDIFYQALGQGTYECFLGPESTLPMMMMEDAIRATIELMEAPSEKIAIRSSYNLSGVSFSPAELAAEITRHIPGFSITYQPDFRQALANSWPASIDDSKAHADWGWKARYDLPLLVKSMIEGIRKKMPAMT